MPAVTSLLKRLRPPRARCMKKGILAIGLRLRYTLSLPRPPGQQACLLSHYHTRYPEPLPPPTNTVKIAVLDNEATPIRPPKSTSGDPLNIPDPSIHTPLLTARADIHLLPATESPLLPYSLHLIPSSNDCPCMPAQSRLSIDSESSAWHTVKETLMRART
ncbi:hypothetical protein ARMGADRAFT_1092178 [Armillaria gallica]|uniref:Uncharacterized protein n=1 Tax=Armillaria gallica TaxID=47427 RepID=A0A2H3CBN8_ARMGA|nr:hypothetical protein ARMGADRAFT_1092178 [Armillaria gallica]